MRPVYRYFTDEAIGNAYANVKNEGDESRAIICVPMSAVLAAVGVKEINFMVIDTEGNEPQIISSIDFDAVKIDYFMIECNDCHYKKDGKNEIGVPTCDRQRLLKKMLSARGFEELLFIPPIDIVYKRRTLSV